MIVLGELGVRGEVVTAAANDLHIFRGELRAQALKRSPLRGSSTRARPWIKPEDHLLARVVRERDGLPGVALYGKGWRLIPDL